MTGCFFIRHALIALAYLLAETCWTITSPE